jgi:hypothetical protein
MSIDYGALTLSLDHYLAEYGCFLFLLFFLYTGVTAVSLFVQLRLWRRQQQAPKALFPYQDLASQEVQDLEEGTHAR